MEEHTFSDGGSWVAAVGAGFLLNVKRSRACLSIVSMPTHGIDNRAHRSNAPQRLHRTCVLLWRLPKLDVPFAVQCVSLPTLPVLFLRTCLLILALLDEGLLKWSRYSRMRNNRGSDGVGTSKSSPDVVRQESPDAK